MPRRRHYLSVPRQLVSDRTILSSDLRVIAVLLDMRNSANEVEGGLDVIAERTGLTKRTVCNVLPRLEERGLIKRESRRGPYTGLITLSNLARGLGD